MSMRLNVRATLAAALCLTAAAVGQTTGPSTRFDDPLAVAASRGDVEAVFRRLASDRPTHTQLNNALLASLRDALDGYRGRGQPSPYIDGDDLPEPVGLDVERRLAEITRLLIAAGADARSPEMIAGAARRGSLAQVDALLTAGADANARYEDEVPLTGAVRQRDRAIVQRLLEAGAIPRPTTRGTRDEAAMVGLPADDAEMLRLLLDRVAPARGPQTRPAEGRDAEPDRQTALALVSAARKLDADTVALLIDRGVRQPRALQDAVRAMVQEFGEARRARKLEPPPRDRAEVIPRKRTRVLDLLFDAGLDPSAIDGSGSLLIEAILAGDNFVAAVLRRRGARFDSEATARLMQRDLRPGATLPTTGPGREWGSGFYSYPTLFNDVEVVRELAKAGVPMPLNAAALVGDIDRVRELLRLDPEGVNRYPSDNGGFGALRMAAINGHVEVCRMLIDAGAHVNPPKVGSQGWGGMTPLEAAAINGHADAVRLLLERGARVDVSNVTDTNTTLLQHVERFVARQREEKEGRRLLGVIEVLPLLREAAARQASP